MPPGAPSHPTPLPGPRSSPCPAPAGGAQGGFCSCAPADNEHFLNNSYCFSGIWSSVAGQRVTRARAGCRGGCCPQVWARWGRQPSPGLPSDAEVPPAPGGLRCRPTEAFPHAWSRAPACLCPGGDELAPQFHAPAAGAMCPIPLPSPGGRFVLPRRAGEPGSLRCPCGRPRGWECCRRPSGNGSTRECLGAAPPSSPGCGRGCGRGRMVLGRGGLGLGGCRSAPPPRPMADLWDLVQRPPSTQVMGGRT